MASPQPSPPEINHKLIVDTDPPRDSQIPFWLYPQVLSLDAPAVAVCWQWLFAKSFGVPISPVVLFVTAACVWMIYAADHLLDVREGAVYSARHRFMHGHQSWVVVVAVAVFASAAVASSHLPFSIWKGAVELTAVVGVYLAFVHALGERARRCWPKEFVIGAVFAAGSTLATWTALDPARHAWPEIVLFAALCTLNCCAVDCWEWQQDRVLLRYPQRLTRTVGRQFLPCAVGLMIVSSAVFSFTRNRVALAIVLSVGLLLLVNARRCALPAELARLLADATLLTPFVFLLR